jgi:hypothetical protein
MSRYNDVGHYEVGNVFIQLHSQNSRDTCHLGQKPSFGMLGKLHAPGAKQQNSIKNRGSNNVTALLNEEKVRQIKILLAQGVKHPILANMFGVAKPTISAISTGRNWKHVII